LIADDVVKLNMSEIMFKNGSIIRVLPAIHENVRGETADMVIVDEAAFVNDEIFAAIEPALAVRNGTMILLSTPFEPKGFFYNAWTSPDWSKHHVTTYDNPLIDEEFIERYKKEHTEVEFRREILGEFVETGESVLYPLELVSNAMKLRKYGKPLEGYVYVMGVDVARFGTDSTAVVLVGKNVTDPDAPLEMHTYYLSKKQPLNKTIGYIHDIVMKWRPRKVYIDTIGLGAGVHDVLRENLGNVIESVEARGRERVEMYFAVKRLLEDGQLILVNDNKVLEHFLNYEIKYNADGNARIIKKASGHDDIADAVVYACWGWINEMGYEEKVYVADFDLDSLIDKATGFNSRNFNPFAIGDTVWRRM